MRITVTGADRTLFHLAMRIYGDATLWLTLADANGLIDPQVSGVRQIAVPPAATTQTGGIPET